MFIYIESLGWITPLVAAVLASSATFLLTRYAPPRRRVELIRVDDIYRTALEDGWVYLIIPFVVRYDGPEVVPLPMAEWIPIKVKDKEFLEVQREEQRKIIPPGAHLHPRGNWSIYELKTHDPREGLKLFPGETVTIEVSLSFPPAVWQHWRDHPVPGKIRLQYGRKRFLTFKYDLVL